MKIMFDPETEKKEINRMMKSTNLYLALLTISNEIFRPARKHGYSQSKIQKLLDKCGDNGYELIGELEDLFYTILEEESIDIHEDLD